MNNVGTICPKILSGKNCKSMRIAEFIRSGGILRTHARGADIHRLKNVDITDCQVPIQVHLREPERCWSMTRNSSPGQYWIRVPNTQWDWIDGNCRACCTNRKTTSPHQT